MKSNLRTSKIEFNNFIDPQSKPQHAPFSAHKVAQSHFPDLFLIFLSYHHSKKLNFREGITLLYHY